MTDITKILSQIENGDATVTDELLPLVYDELRRLAAAKIASERPGQTLQATALVHEAYLRLATGRKIPWGSEVHFYTAAAEAMRHVLLDHARSKGRVKRGGGRSRAPLNVLDLAEEPDSEEILALDHQLQRLEERHPEASAVVRLRFYAGMTIDDTAKVLGWSPRHVDRLWAYARAWLYRELNDQ